MANASTSQNPPIYEEAILYPVESENPVPQQHYHQHQHHQNGHQHYHNDPLATGVTTSNVSSTPLNTLSKTSNFALTTSPSVTPQVPAIQLTSTPGYPQPAPGALNISVPNPRIPGTNESGQPVDSIDTPAIIIHSAISTPGDENVPRFPESPSPIDGYSATKPTHQTEQSRHDFASYLDFQDPEPNPVKAIGHHIQPFDQGTEKDDAGFGKINFTNPNRSIDPLKNNGIKSVEPVSMSSKPNLGYRTGIGITGTQDGRGRNVKVSEVYVDVHDSDYQFEPECPRRNTVSSSDEYQRCVDKAFRLRNIAKSSGMSNSLDNQWVESSVTDKLLIHSDSSSPKDIRHKRIKIQPSIPQPSRGGPTASLLPSTSKMSKSYSDLSHRHRTGTPPYVYCDKACSHNHSPSHQRSGAMGLYTAHNKSSSNVNRTGEHHHHHRYHKHHLLPETRSFQGSRGMRSVSENDVRMRSGTDEYEWKDGKVRMKNGEMSHGESVRYVWKDGHVEKITTDANNEDTQVEILETAENKTCSKINPVFICVFLIAVIAIVIILPVYFAS